MRPHGRLTSRGREGWEGRGVAGMKGCQRFSYYGCFRLYHTCLHYLSRIVVYQSKWLSFPPRPTPLALRSGEKIISVLFILGYTLGLARNVGLTVEVLGEPGRLREFVFSLMKTRGDSERFIAIAPILACLALSRNTYDMQALCRTAKTKIRK